MITFEPCIRNIRSDGYAKVYIRIIKDTKPAYIATDYMASKKQCSGNKLKDHYLIAEISPIIKKYYNLINGRDISTWSLQEVIEYLKMDKDAVSFTDFLLKYVDNMINKGRANPAKNYITALNSLQKFSCKKKSIVFGHNIPIDY